jgi:dTDP-glucose pyrophosphorylase
MSPKLFSETTIAIIPSAGSKQRGAVSDAMITVAGKPAIFWTIQELLSHGIRQICIVVRDKDGDLEKFVRLMYEGLADIAFVVPNRMAGVGYSVACGVEAVNAWGKPTLVVLGDTILSTADFRGISGSWVAVSEVEDQKRWCMVRLEGERVEELYDKPSAPVPSTLACTGIYYFHAGLSVGLVEIDEIVGRSGRMEMADHLRPLVDCGSLFGQITNNWFDVGNPDHLQDARQRLIQSRSFNSLELDPLRGVVTKRSTYSSKFYDEINYFKLLPDDLVSYFPRILASSNLPGAQYVKMEYYAYPTLADLFLFEELPLGFWRKTFSRLKAVSDDFARFDYGLDEPAAADIYVKKNIGRFESYLATAPSLAEEFINAEAPRVNGERVVSPRDVIERSKHRLEILAKTAKWTPIHGDLCLSNILCEPDSGLLKLLDPRGSFGRQGVLGDIRYDIAKLTHSIIGRYDFIVNDLFRVEIRGSDLTLELPFRRDIQPIVSEFERIFFVDEQNRDDISLITAWLFLSMLPLHADKPKRQLAMMAVGLQFFTKIS